MAWRFREVQSGCKGSPTIDSQEIQNLGGQAESLEACREAVAREPYSAEAHENLGLCYLMRNEFATAASCLQHAVQLNPEIAPYHHNLALALQALGRNGEAMRRLQTAVSLAPDFTPSYACLGQLLLVHGDPAGAQECFRKVAQLDPESPVGYVYLARALIQEERAQEAEENVRTALKLDSGSVEAFITLGNVMQQTGRFDEAIDTYNTALGLDPKRVGLYFDIFQCRKMRETDRAVIGEVEKIVSQGGLSSQDSRSLNYALGKAYDDLGEFGRAIRYFDEANRIAESQLRESGHGFSAHQLKAETDRIIGSFGHESMTRPVPGSSDSDLPVFIVGLVRSGSTLVEQILSSHPNVGTAGELHFWPEVAAKLFEGRMGPPGPAVFAQIAREYLDHLTRLQPGKSRVIDKMNANYKLIGLIRLVFPNARFICSIRHPVDNCLSIYMMNFGQAAATFAHTRENLVVNYREYSRLMAHWRDALPRESIVDARYEEIVNERTRVTRELISFCGLQWDDACLRYEQNERVVKTRAFWQVRQPIYRTSMERWRDYEPWLGALRELL